jgi:hypothetical protein
VQLESQGPGKFWQGSFHISAAGALRLRPVADCHLQLPLPQYTWCRLGWCLPLAAPSCCMRSGHTTKSAPLHHAPESKRGLPCVMSIQPSVQDLLREEENRLRADAESQPAMRTAVRSLVHSYLVTNGFVDTLGALEKKTCLLAENSCQPTLCCEWIVSGFNVAPSGSAHGSCRRQCHHAMQYTSQRA